jgi:hypothetical protein
MGAVLNYWQLSLPDFNGKRKRRTIGVAQSYLQTQFPQLLEAEIIEDAPTQRQLLAAMQVQPAQEQLSQDQPSQYQQFQFGPALSLRCCVSDYIYQACLGIVRKFDLSYQSGRQSASQSFSQQISIADLLPLVLNDDGFDPQKSLERRGVSKPDVDRGQPDRSQIPQPPLSFSVLKTWNPDKSNLNTWTNHHVLQNSDIAQTLAENGILLISDWALLNDTSINQLQNILTGITSQLTPAEVTISCQTLQAYHAIYREDRIQARLSGTSRSRCKEPSDEQLARIKDYLRTTFNLDLNVEPLLQQIKRIASQVRQYRIARKGGPIRVDSLDEPDVQVSADAQSGDSDLDQNQTSEFIAAYRQDFIECLNGAIGVVIEAEFQRLKKRSGGKPNEFILGLELVHCQGRSMTEVAPQIGLEQQYQVSRLLKLENLRMNIRQRALVLLRDRVRQKVVAFVSPEQLDQLDQRLDQLLDEQLETVMQAASTESMSPNTGQPQKNQLARRICEYLDTRP